MVNSPLLYSLWKEREGKLTAKTAAHPIEVALIEVTRRCNLRCIHCGTPPAGSREDEVTVEEITGFLNQIFREYPPNAIKFVSLTGGEPTVRGDLPEIISAVRGLGISKVVMHSNGHKLVTEKGYFRSLLDAGITGIGINIDGLEETHNLLRAHDDSFRICNDCAKILNKEYPHIGVLVSTVVSKLNVNELNAIHDLLEKLGIRRWRLILLEPIGRAVKEMKEYLLEPDDFEKIIRFILDVKSRKPITIPEIGCGQWLGKDLEGIARPYIWHCIAGINTIGLMYDGSIGGCNNIDRAYLTGHIQKDNVLDVWHNRFGKFREFEWKRTGMCKNCDDWDLCHGGEMHRRDEGGNFIGKCFFRFRS